MISHIQCNIELKNFDIMDKMTKRSLEDSLPEFNFNYLAAPLNAPSEIPRMFGGTQNGKVTLQFSLKLAILQIQFDEKDMADRELCLKIVRKYIEYLKNALQQIPVEIVFIGIISHRLLQLQGEPMSQLRQHLLNIDTGSYPLFNTTVKFAIVFEDHYFINTTISEISDQEQTLIEIDINDRYDANKGRLQDINDIDRIMNIQAAITEDVIKHLIDTGEMSLK